MAVAETNYQLPGQTDFSRGSVRDIYTIDDKYLVMVVTDRISAFDVLLPVAITHKGEVLAQIASYFLQATKDIIPNWLISSPAPNVVIGHKCQAYKVEVVVRGYLTGHAWREYRDGQRQLCGVPLPESLRENDRLPQLIITPATHASEGHDEDISKQEIIEQKLVPADVWTKIEDCALKLFQRGAKMAAERGLILVDTKYEFGNKDGNLVLIDEVHTPDSSRYFYADDYSERLKQRQPQRQLSKEFVREWLIERGFQGLPGQVMPKLTDSFVKQVSQRYIELYQQLLGKKFEPAASTGQQLEAKIIKALEDIRGQ